MSRRVDVIHRASGVRLVQGARWCASFWCRLRGLMFRRRLEPGEAVLLVEAADSRVTTSIHMFFVPFPIAAIWINSAGQVVDKVEALPNRPYYAPRRPARFTLEGSPALLSQVAIDDELVFEDSALAAGR